MPRWAWGVGVACAVLALVLLGLLGMLWLQEPEPVPTSQPLRIRMAEGAVPPPAPVKPPPVVESPPPTPPANPTVTQAQPPSDEPEEHETDIGDTDRMSERRPPPTLRKRDAGIAPKRIVRKTLGRTSGKGIAKLQLVATYGGGSISAPVEIDGVWRGNTPLTVTLKGGSHAIRIDHGPTRVNQFVTDVDGGKSVNMEVELRPASEWRGNGPSKWGKRHHH